MCFKKTSRLTLVTIIFGLINPSILLAMNPTDCLPAPALPSPTGTIVTVSNEAQLQSAISNLSANTTIIIKSGRYNLSSTLYVKKSNIVIRGESDRCDSVELIGRGMENANRGDVGSGIWINSDNVTVANMTISEVYFHPIEMNNQPDDVHIYNVRMLNAGEQFVKSSSAGRFGEGSNFGKVEYSIMEYTASPPLTDHGGGTGYTNGVDVHGGDGWEIRNNVFKNFHTPDNADHLWNPAVLMWNGARNTITENNVFINVDRAIAYGLINRGNDHQGGIIRNNMITMSPNLYSASRKSNSDGHIAIYDSPNTKVIHNTVLSNGNTLKSIEMRFGSSGVEVANNIVDAPIIYREGRPFSMSNNYTNATGALFVNAAIGNLHLKPSANVVKDKVSRRSDAILDFDGQTRPTGKLVDLGADEASNRPPSPDKPPTPTNKKSFIGAILMLLLD